MAFEIKNTCYTTLDRQATFRFDFVQVSAHEWRVYITEQPSYNGRPDGTHPSHRLTDARGRYICWVPAPTTLDQAKGAARAWADATWDYILTGVFPAPGPAREVPDLSSSATWALRDHVGLITEAPAPIQYAQPAPRQAPRPASAYEPMHVHPSRPTGLRGLFSNRRNNQ
jgi:hypothetical protein